MTDSVTTHIDKGKTIALSPPSPPPHRRGSKGVVISEPRTTASPGISSGTRQPFTRQTAQDYNEAQQNNLVDHSVSVSNQRTHHSQLFSVDDFQEDSPALYVDAALDHNHGLTGIGFTFKIGHHQIVASENRRLPGASTPIFAEGQALLQGLSWCVDSQLQPEFIFSDYLNLVSKVKGNWQDHSVLSGLVSQIKLFFSNFPEASLKYLPRQFNTVAHRLAKDAIRLREEGHEELI
ncbi:hypothetical protein F8388_012652 [Cannabis sativa]|nr:hypothetical protein F8388_012652 [Cannabis sativa]